MSWLFFLNQAKFTHHTEPKTGAEESQGPKDVPKEDTAVRKDSKDIPMSRKESGEESKTPEVSASEKKTSIAPSDLPVPTESSTVTAEKVEKLASPPPERADADDAAVNEPLENERFINNILSRLRKIRGQKD